MGKAGLSTRLVLLDEEIQSYLRHIQNNGSRRKIYEFGKTSKNPIGADANRAIHGRKQKGTESTLPTNPEMGRAGKHKKKMQAIREIGRPEVKHACCMARVILHKSENY